MGLLRVTMFITLQLSILKVCSLPYSSDTLIDKGIRKLRIAQFDSAIYYLNDAEKISFEERDLLNWIKATQIKIQIFQTKTQEREKSLLQIDKCLMQADSFPNLDSLANLFGWYYILAYRDSKHLGFVYEAGNYLEEGRLFFESLLSRPGLTRQRDSLYKRWLFLSIYPELGDLQIKLGALNEALELVQSGIKLSLAEKVAPDVLAIFYLKEGAINLFTGNNSHALRVFRKGMQLDSLSPEISGSFYLNSGMAYLEMDNYPEAISSAQTSLDFYLQTPQKTRRQQGESHLQLGLIYQELGQYTRSVQYFRQAIQLGRSHYSRSENPLSAKAYRMLGKLYADRGEYVQAIGYYQEGLQCALPGFVPLDEYEIPPDSLIFNDMELLHTLGGKAEALLQIGRSGVQDSTLLLRALEHYKLLDELEERLRLSYNYEASKLRAEARSRTYYEQAIATSKALYDLTGSKAYLHRAFEFAEKSKAWVLWESINQSQARTVAEIPEELRTLERNLQLEIANYERNVETESQKDHPDYHKIAEWETILNDNKMKRRRLLGRLEIDYPRYYQLKYDVQVASIEDVQNGLNQDEAFIEYFYGDEYLYTFLITSSKVGLLQSTVDTTLQHNLSALEQVLVSKSFGENMEASWEQFDHHAYQVYQQILEPLKDSLKEGTHLIIVPDGGISHIPFEVLIDQPSPVQGEKRNFLIYDYPMSYDFSATMHFQQKTVFSDKPVKCLGVAPDFTYAQTYPLAPIPNVEGLKKIEKIVGGTFLYEPHATEGKFKDMAGEYGILHLATHGKMDTAHLYSWLAFTENDDPEDDYLYAYELYAMRLKGHLAVLGACETGLGKYQKGEGFMSMARAFAYAGCPALVTSLWEAQDMITTNDILPEFYLGLKQGLTKSAALRQAKLKYLSKSSGMDVFPFFWAAFVSTGDQSPLNLAPPETSHKVIPWYYSLAFGIFLISTLMYWYVRSRRPLKMW